MTDKVRLMGGGARPGALSSLTAGLAVALVVVTALCGCRDTDGPKSQGAYDWRTLYDEWEEPAPLPHFELVDQAGAEFSLARYEDAFVLVGFVFTRCAQPKACPLTMQRFNEVQTSWEAAVADGRAAGRRLELLILTLDPDYDTPARLAAYARGYEADFTHWTMATGPTELLESAIPSLFAVLALPKGDGDIAHTVKVAVLAPGMNHLRDWPDNEFTVADVLQTVLDHKPDPED